MLAFCQVFYKLNDEDVLWTDNNGKLIFSFHGGEMRILKKK